MNFRDVTVLCVGDVMLDRFVYGTVERISPEAPVPVMRLGRTQEMLGGVGNVASNIAALGGCARLIGLVGMDEAGARVQQLGQAFRGIEASLVPTSERPTICKTRFIAGQQQVVRTDDESQLALQPREEAEILRRVDDLLAEADVVILSDYGKGLLSPAVLRRVIAAAKEGGKPVFVDPKTDDFSRYAGATCITPNAKELALASGMPVDSEEDVARAARALLAQTEAKAILVTRSERGMMLVTRSGKPVSVPAMAREVFDVSGAGDTVIATLALATASGRSLEQAMRVANAAAGVVVSKLGTATATVQEVLDELERQDHVAESDLLGDAPLPVVEAIVARWKGQGLRVGLTNGCFDIIHPGHIALLKAARARCDRLVVALNTDASVRSLKGPARPVYELAHRAQVMAAIRYVDCVVSFGEPTPLQIIERLRPDVLIKGADYRLEDVVGADVVQSYGGEVVLANVLAGLSTTAIIKRVSTRQEVAQPAA